MAHELYAFRRIFHVGNACFFWKAFYIPFDAAEPRCGDRILGKFKGCQPQVLSHFFYFWSAANIYFDLLWDINLLDMPKNKSGSIFSHWAVGLDRCGVNWLYCMRADALYRNGRYDQVCFILGTRFVLAAGFSRQIGLPTFALSYH